MLTDVKNIAHSGVISYGISVHLPTFIIKKRQHVTPEHEYVYKRSFKNYDCDTLAKSVHDFYFGFTGRCQLSLVYGLQRFVRNC